MTLSLDEAIRASQYRPIAYRDKDRHGKKWADKTLYMYLGNFISKAEYERLLSEVAK